MNCIGTQPSSPSNKMPAIADSGASTHLAKQDTTTMAPVIMSNEMKSILPDGITIEYSHITTLQVPGLSKQVSQIHNFQQMKTAPLISLGFLCYDG